MIYIGRHVTTKLTDSYFGSGRELKNAIKEFGINNFQKDILFVFDNINDMIDKETELVNDDFRKRLDTYNLALGGNGFGMLGVKLSEETCKKMSDSRTGKSRTFSKTHCENISKSRKGSRQTDEANQKRRLTQTGQKRKPHTDETKHKISLGNSGKKLTAERKKQLSVSVKGTIWVSNIELQKTKMIKPELLEKFLQNGWELGRFNLIKHQ